MPKAEPRRPQDQRRTRAEEARLARAQEIVSAQRKKAVASFNSRDFGLVQTVYDNLTKRSICAAVEANDLGVLLAHVQYLLEARKKKDEALPEDVRVLVDAFAGFMGVGGQTIANLRKRKTTGSLSKDEAARLTGQLQELTAKVKDLLDSLK